MWNRICWGHSFAWCCLLLSVVFFRTSDQQAVNPYFCFYWIMAVLSGSVLLHSLVSPRGFRCSVSDALVSFFICYGLALSLVSGTVAVTRLEILFLSGVAYVCFRWVLSSHRRAWLYVCLVLVATGLVEACGGLSQLYGFSASSHFLFKLTGTFFNPGPYSGYLALVLPVALYLMLKYQSYASPRWSPAFLFLSGVYYLSAATVCSIILVLPASMSRSGWLGALIGSLWVWQERNPTQTAQKQWMDMKSYLSNSAPQKEDMNILYGIYPLLDDHVLFLFDYGKALADCDSLDRSTEVFMRALSFGETPCSAI